MSDHPTGHIYPKDAEHGEKIYARLRLPDGRQPNKLLGKLWTKRSKPDPGFVTRGQAEARLAAMKAGADPSINLRPSKVTFQRACEEHLRCLERERLRKASYLRDCRNAIHGRLVPFLGADTPVEKVTTARVDALRDRLLDEVSNKTAQKLLTLLHGILGTAVQREWIAVNPAEKARKVAVPRSGEFNVLDVEAVEAVSRTARGDGMAELVLVAAFTGLRQGELLALRWRDIDFTGRIVHVRRNLPAGATVEELPKSHRVRSVPMSDQALVALDALSRREHFTDPDALVFCTVVGTHLNDDRVRDAFYRALERAGHGYLRASEHPIVFHDLRHTFGTLCASQGIDLVKIKSWMGHADLQTTERYLHHVPRHDDAALLSQAFAMERPVERTAEKALQLNATQTPGNRGGEPRSAGGFGL